MTDYEMTEACGKAMGLHLLRGTHWNDGPYYVLTDAYPVDGEPYRPLENDAQAMALVKHIGLTIDPQEDKPPFTWRVVVADDGDWDKQIFSQGSDLNRAIVECVAKISSSSQSANHGKANS